MQKPSLANLQRPTPTAPGGENSSGRAHGALPQFFSRLLGQSVTPLLAAVACSALLQVHSSAAQEPTAPVPRASVPGVEPARYLAQTTDGQSQDAARPPRATEKSAEPDAVAEDQKQSELDDYEASEQISEDLSVSFPVDI